MQQQERPSTELTSPMTTACRSIRACLRWECLTVEHQMAMQTWGTVTGCHDNSVTRTSLMK